MIVNNECEWMWQKRSWPNLRKPPLSSGGTEINHENYGSGESMSRTNTKWEALPTEPPSSTVRLHKGKKVILWDHHSVSLCLQFLDWLTNFLESSYNRCAGGRERPRPLRSLSLFDAFSNNKMAGARKYKMERARGAGSRSHKMM
jgi:hypothetical protein